MDKQEADEGSLFDGLPPHIQKAIVFWLVYTDPQQAGPYASVCRWFGVLVTDARALLNQGPIRMHMTTDDSRCPPRQLTRLEAALTNTCERGDVEMLEVLSRHLTDVSRPQHLPLRLAVAHNFEPLAIRLCECYTERNLLGASDPDVWVIARAGIVHSAFGVVLVRLAPLFRPATRMLELCKKLPRGMVCNPRVKALIDRAVADELANDHQRPMKRRRFD